MLITVQAKGECQDFIFFGTVLYVKSSVQLENAFLRLLRTVELLPCQYDVPTARRTVYAV